LEVRMNFIHGREYLNSDQSYRVNCDKKCYIRVMNDHNFNRYRSGQGYSYYGGFYGRMPAIIRPPHAGYWNVVIDLGGASGTISYSLEVIG